MRGITTREVVGGLTWIVVGVLLDADPGLEKGLDGAKCRSSDNRGGGGGDSSRGAPRSRSWPPRIANSITTTAHVKPSITSMELTRP